MLLSDHARIQEFSSGGSRSVGQKKQTLTTFFFFFFSSPEPKAHG